MAFPANIELSLLNGADGFTLYGEAAGDHSGWSVASAGDLNGDGYADLIVGAPVARPNGSFSGASYVVFGKASGFDSSIELSSLDGSNGFKLNGASGVQAGFSVASAGDLNGDGLDDLIVGAPHAGDGGTMSGTSYVVFGKASGFDPSIELSSLDGSDGFKLIGAAGFEYSGTSVASAGDVNGDGYDDLIIGSPGAYTGHHDIGASYVVFGSQAGFGTSINLSALNGSNGFRLSGVVTEDPIGGSVASAGDVNGDGFDDVIVGAIGTYGASYVVFGKASGFDADISISSLNGGNGFKLIDGSGKSVASAGDVNGDGYDDLIIGSGTASYVVFGKGSGFAPTIDLATLNGSNGFKVSGAPVDKTGTSVASAGDVNGDGFDDLIVGSPGVTVGAYHFGASYVVFGKASGFVADLDPTTLDGHNGFKLTGPDFTYSGTSVASAGDVNGDGFDDLIVGSWFAASVGGNHAGASYIVFGGAFGENEAPVMTTGTGAAEILIGGNGDDVLVGGGGADVFHGGAGDDRLSVPDYAYRLVDGGSGTDTVALDAAGLSFYLTSPEWEGKFESIERFDLTGTGDNILGIDQSAVLGGLGAVVGGKRVLTVEGDAGDGVRFADMGWTRTTSFTDASGTFDRWVFGNAEVDVEQGLSVQQGIDVDLLDGTTGFKLDGPSSSKLSGWSVASAGDINGDGVDDVIVGLRPNDGSAGGAYVVYGRTSGATNINLANLDSTAGFRLSGGNSSLGTSIASAGDLNGDGFDDLLISQPQSGVSAPANGGWTYVVFGKASSFGTNLDVSTLDGTTGFRLNGAAVSERIGTSVASAGDVNGDGYDDLIIGARYGAPHGASSGASYVVFGKASGFSATVSLSTLDGTNGFKLSGEAAGNRSGNSVASAGDFNGDGFDDLIIGAPSASPNGNLSGAAYIVYGKASGFTANIELSSLDGSNGFQLNGNGAYSAVGASLASAGDVNGDGFDDVIIAGANLSYVVFGKASGFGANFELSTLNGTNGFKLGGLVGSVASAGDVNGDGFTDIILGSASAYTHGFISGAAYVVFGKASGFDTTITLAELDGGDGGFRISGAQPYDDAGASVASAGDVNGDGYDDLIVGAPSADPNGGRSGQSYVIFGGAFGGGDAPVMTTGTSAGEVLMGGNNDDVLTGGGGADVFHAGAGDDRIVVSDTGFALVDGGNGGDTLVLDGADLTLDLTDPTVRIEGIERIDLRGTGANTLVLDTLGDLGAAAGGKQVLMVLGDSDDTVQLTARWAKIGTFTNSDGTFTRYESGGTAVDVEQGISVPPIVIEGTSGNDTISLTQTVPGQSTATYRDDVLNGYDGDDVLDGSVGADIMTGGDGNDYYYVDNVNDQVWELENEGYDFVLTTVSYTLAAGTHVEALSMPHGFDAINLTGNELDNTLYGNAVSNVLTGGAGNDTLVGNQGADTMIGGHGNDMFEIDELGDVVVEDLNDGIDTISSWISFDLRTVANIENLTLREGNPNNGIGNQFNNVITGNELANVLTGNQGNDTLDGRAGADQMVGGSGNDIYYVDNEDDVIVELAGGGNDKVFTTLSSFTLLNTRVETLEFIGTGGSTGYGNAVDNTLIGGAGNDALYGGDGNDTLRGGAGADQMVGGSGNDIYYVDDAGDTVVEVAGGGSDKVFTTLSSYGLPGTYVEQLEFIGTGNFTGYGNASANTLIGGAGNDTLYGEAGNDTLKGGAGADLMVGGSGNDIYYVDNAGDTVVEVAGGGIDKVFTTLSSYGLPGTYVEQLEFIGTGDFAGYGNASANILIGGAGNDVLYGEAGNDTLKGGAGADHMVGGSGDDIYYVDNVGDAVVEVNGGGTDKVFTTLSSYGLPGTYVEQLEFIGTGDFAGYGNASANILIGGAGNDVLYGEAGNDTLKGGAGADLMVGGSGDDIYYVDDAGDAVVEMAGGGTDKVFTTLSSYGLPGTYVEQLEFIGTGDFAGYGNASANILIGGAGNDMLYGEAGNDTLKGGAGNDVLVGGRGADTLTGGSGADAFVFREIADSTHAARDTITDFTVGQDNLDFMEMSSSFHALQTVMSAPTTIDAHSLVAFVSGGNTVLYVNDTGAAQTTSHASMEILLNGVTTLGNADLDYHLI